MARNRDLLVNFERMRREMDELFGSAWGEAGWRANRPQIGFSPRVDVYYCDAEPPRAVVKVELAGVHLDTVELEVAGRQLVVAGERPVQETEGRIYQQVEIEAGPHRITAAITRDAVEELGLVEGARATAAVKATSVMIERDG